MGAAARSFLNSKFDAQQKNTIGAAFGAKRVYLPNGRGMTLGIWDTAGAERFESLSRVYYHSVRALASPPSGRRHPSIMCVSETCACTSGVPPRSVEASAVQSRASTCSEGWKAELWVGCGLAMRSMSAGVWVAGCFRDAPETGV